MVDSKIRSRFAPTHKVINYTSNGTMLHFFLNTLHWLLYIDILITMFNVLQRWHCCWKPTLGSLIVWFFKPTLKGTNLTETCCLLDRDHILQAKCLIFPETPSKVWWNSISQHLGDELSRLSVVDIFSEGTYSCPSGIPLFTCLVPSRANLKCTLHDVQSWGCN
jgi:hypothetical protein